jgi:hypothetical protein
MTCQKQNQPVRNSIVSRLDFTAYTRFGTQAAITHGKALEGHSSICFRCKVFLILEYLASQCGTNEEQAE